MRSEPYILAIEKAAYLGYGLARLDGKTYFVPLALPGDVVSVRTTSDKGDYAFARIEDIITPSPMRLEAPCSSFGTCGGCSYLNTDYPNELVLKREILLDCMHRIGKFPGGDLPEIRIVSGERFHYRSHGEIKVMNGRGGFYRADSRELVPFPELGCCLLADEINDFLKQKAWKDGGVKIALGSDGRILSDSVSSSVVRERERNIRYERDIRNFFQGNRFMRGMMLDLAGEFAALSLEEKILDVDCGVGFFTLFLARQCSFAFGIDIDSKGILHARNNARINGISNVKFEVRSDVSMEPSKFGADAVIADPPRAGLARKARDAIKAIGPSRIVYVSCNPSSFARDARDFCDGGFVLKKLVLIDMFPATSHIEVISLLERVG